jgi:hypothetical protein
MRRERIDFWLALVVFGHLAITVVHGAAHAAAQVSLGPFAMLFVLLVIEIAPVAGFVTSIRSPRAGAALVGASMAGALVFGWVNHFVLSSPDHVDHVVETWRPLFATTAWLLMLSEAAGVVAAVRRLKRPSEVVS